MIEAIDPDVFASKSAELAEKVHQTLAGHHPAIQGAAMADCVSTWLAGHKVDSADHSDSDKLRETLLADFIETVNELLPLNVDIVHGTKP